MRRIFWLALGASAGIYIARRITRTAEALTPQSIADSIALSLATLGEAIRDFAVEVRAGMTEREAVLVEALGVNDTAPTRESIALDEPPRRFLSGG